MQIHLGNCQGSINLRSFIWEKALENKQAEYQSPMIEVEGKIDNHHISILIGYGAIHSYINSNIVEIFHFQRINHNKSWLVQLAIGAKRKIK